MFNLKAVIEYDADRIKSQEIHFCTLCMFFKRFSYVSTLDRGGFIVYIVKCALLTTTKPSEGTAIKQCAVRMILFVKISNVPGIYNVKGDHGIPSRLFYNE